MYASASTGQAVFSWIISDPDAKAIGMLIRVPPDRHRQAVQDMTQLVGMLIEAGLDPQLTSQIVRANTNSPANVTVSWTGTVNDIDKVQELLGKMTEIWRG